MTLDHELSRLLGRPGARVLAFEPSGGRSLPLPAELSRRGVVVVDADGPLDAIAPASHGQAVVAYEEARRLGRGAGSIRLTGETEDHRIEIFDLEEHHGCFLAVVLPIDDGSEADGPVAALAPLRATYELNVTGVIQAISPEFTAMLGWTEEEAVGRSSLDLIHQHDHEAGIVAWVELLERPNNETRLRQRFLTSSGDWLWCEVTDANHLDGRSPHIRGELVDISREMAAHAALERRERLLDRLSRALPSGVCYLDTDGVASVCNDRWQELTGLSQDDGLAPLIANLSAPIAVERAVDRAVADGVDLDLDVVFVAGSGACQFGNLHLRPLREDGEHIGLLVTLDDVTSLRSYQLKLADQTRRDPLTGIYNRAGIEEALLAKLSGTPARPDADGGGPGQAGGVAVMFIDLDRFKHINDTHGHAVGDRVLRLVAGRIDELLRAGDDVGRIGGDEFLVVLGDGTSAEQAELAARRIGAAIPLLARSIDVPIELGASIGVAMATPADDFDSLIRRADQAMYRAKRGTTGARPPRPGGAPLPGEDLGDGPVDEVLDRALEGEREV